MHNTERVDAVSAWQQTAHLVTGASHDYDPLLDLVGDARFVLLGAPTYGTHEFWAARARITRRLIEEKEFNAVAVDADWSHARHVNRLLSSASREGEPDLRAAMTEIEPFPAWVWHSTALFDFVDWLKQHNSSCPPEQPATGCYGLDFFRSHAAMAAAASYLDRVDPALASRARDYFARVDLLGIGETVDPSFPDLDLNSTLKEELVAHLVEWRRAAECAAGDEERDQDVEIYAAQSALSAPNVKRYYRKMLSDGRKWWKLRNRHLAEMMNHLAEELARFESKSKVVVWAHQFLVGDARATQLRELGVPSFGQILRETHGQDVVLVGFSTFCGTVTAASEWDSPGEPKRLDAAMPESNEALLHETGHPRFFLTLRGTEQASVFLSQERLQRAVGVVYDPDDPRFTQPYVKVRLADQLDAVIHFDQTTAIQPVEHQPQGEGVERPESVSAAP